eukprot:TRINITY_DN14674_c0_g1_i1.p1 TRINITY_DN14674_c0_g1~~TRINITY_DN14674_c0_g1_i1.p1  ORF type:complete len:121 (-),score=30.32 TRINITY_DN14674_c0_g1_i1:212-574(-)
MSMSRLVNMALQPSANYAEARHKSLQLYRACIRCVPEAKRIYGLDLPEDYIRVRVSDLFRQQAHVQDPRLIDQLVFRGVQELKETIMHWKQKTHVVRMLESVEYRTPSNNFVQRFFAGHQ